LKALRILVGLVVLAVAGWLFASVFSSAGEQEVARTFTSSEQCKACHEVQWAEWQDSWHARSWIDEDVRALSNEFANTDCIDCHAPRPVFETGIGKRVLPRSSRRHEGVDCIACHVLPEGGVAGTIESKSAACRPRVRRELRRAEFCGVCHDQHKTVQQWLATPFAIGEEGDKRSCLDCHMPYRDGDPTKGRDHRSLGGHSLTLLQAATELRGVREGAGWRIEVENVGAGHHYPTDERSRRSDVFWRPASGGAGTGAWRHLYRIRDPYRYEVDVPSTLIAYGETRVIPLVESEAAGAVELALFYKYTPYYEDEARPDPEREAILVHRVVLTP
jgi:nitrate/TMAO reductase-like tetraheme cytochrome c subunit